MVPKPGLEPGRASPLPPQDSVSTKFHHFGICVKSLFSFTFFVNTKVSGNAEILPIHYFVPPVFSLPVSTGCAG